MGKAHGGSRTVVGGKKRTDEVRCRVTSCESQVASHKSQAASRKSQVTSSVRRLACAHPAVCAHRRDWHDVANRPSFAAPQRHNATLLCHTHHTHTHTHNATPSVAHRVDGSAPSRVVVSGNGGNAEHGCNGREIFAPAADAVVARVRLQERPQPGFGHQSSPACEGPPRVTRAVIALPDPATPRLRRGQPPASAPRGRVLVNPFGGGPASLAHNRLACILPASTSQCPTCCSRSRASLLPELR